MDALTLLRQDHREVDALFAKFDKAGPRAKVAKREIVDRVIHALSIHAGIEEGYFYPTIRSEAKGLSDQVLESLEEHHIVKWELAELERTSPDDERFDAKVTVLKENVQHHVDEEERELFPKVRKALSAERLDELGRELEAAKSTVPDRPHPRLPDEPPGNLIASVAAGVVDAARSRASELVGGVTGAAGKVSAVSEPARRRSGTSTTKARKAPAKAAKKTRHAARTVSKTSRKAAKEAAGTARTARASTKRAAGKTTARARAGATRTVKTAKRAS